MLILLVTACLLFVIWGVAYARKSGFFEKYPEKQYLTEQEAATRPYYTGLSDDEKAVYTALYRGINNFEEEIDLPYDADGEEYEKIYCLLEKQEGSLFWLDQSFYTAKKLRKAKIVYRLQNDDQTSEMKQRLADETAEILSGIGSDMSDFDKAVYIHDYIVNNCRYGNDLQSGSDGSTVYDCLVYKKAQCEGYAKAYRYLAGESGLECAVVTGVTSDGENHVWNQVRIDGNWYDLDITWDDNDSQNETRHIYFLCDDKEFYDTHEPKDNNFELYSCENKDGYYVRKDLYITNMNDARSALRRESKAGKKAIELKFSDRKIYDEFKSEYDDGRIIDILTESQYGILGKSISIALRENKDLLCMTILMG